VVAACGTWCFGLQVVGLVQHPANRTHNPQPHTRDKEQIEIRECLLSSGAEYFVFQFAIQKYKD